MIGKTILHYEILEQIGEGGMGTVYKAKDTKLDRFVALKFLPSQLATTEDEKARFIQEAKAASALNHPNVCTIHDIQEYEGKLFIVMEYIDGVTLRDKREQLSEKRILDIGVQAAEGLAAAHEKGIVHRDIKPENIMIRKDGIVQIMDFGLAKLYTDSNVSRLTKAGTTMGTMGYMSPEQVQGLDLDHRSDIFSLGVVLYELFAGESPFKGMHETAIMYEIVNVEAPPIASVKQNIDPQLDGLILECLEKDRDERCQSAKELAKNLRKIKKVSTGNRTSTVFQNRTAIKDTEDTKIPSGVFDVNFKKSIIKNKLLLSIISILSIALLLSIFIYLNTSTILGDKPMHLSLNIKDGIALGSFSSFAISPDGSKIVYTVNEAGSRMLYIRTIDSYEAKPIRGSEGGYSPFFSPNGKWLGFLVQSGIKKVLVSGGAVIEIKNGTPDLPYAFWGSDNYIYYTPSISGGIYRIPVDGGKELLVALPNNKSGVLSYRWPVLLPDNNTLLFTGVSKKESGKSNIIIKSLKSNETNTLIENGSYAQYLNSGYIIYIKDNTLLATKINTENNSISGNSIPIVQNVTTVPQTGQAEYAVSYSGTLVYLSGGAMSLERNLVWVNQKGKILKSTDLKKPVEDLSLSPDGKKVAVTIEGTIYSIWIYDSVRKILSKFTYGSDDRDPLWTHDGKSVIYGSFRNGYYGLFLSSVDNREKEIKLFQSKNWMHAYSITKNGKYLAFTETDSINRSIQNIAVMELKEGAKPEYFQRTQYAKEFPVFSPNDKFLAYASKESGKSQIYVVPFNGKRSKTQASINGGTRPVWSPDGKSLYFINEKNSALLMAPVNIDGKFSAGTPKVVFNAKEFFIITGNYYDAIPGTKNFIMIKEKDSKVTKNSINIITNWKKEVISKMKSAN